MFIRLLLAAVCLGTVLLAQTSIPVSGTLTISGTLDGSGATATISRRGSGVPSSGTCDAAGEVGSDYTDTDTNGLRYFCQKTGASSYAWTAVGSGGGGSLPSQSGNANKFLATDATNPAWRTLTTGASGGLAVTHSSTEASFDIDTAVVPRLAAANAWTGLNTYTPSTAQAITATISTISANANIVEVDPNGTYTLASTPVISNGSNGQLLKVCNIDTTLTLTLPDEAVTAGSNLRLGGANYALAPRACAEFVYTTGAGDWILLDRASSGGGGGAPTTATYITQTADGTLSAEQALGALATGIVKNTTTTGVLSIAVAGTDFQAAINLPTTYVVHNVTPGVGTTAVNTNQSNARIYPVNVPGTGTVSKCIAEVTTAQASGLLHLGLYRSDTGAAICTCSSIDASTTGIKNATCGEGSSQPFPAGQVLVVVGTNNSGIDLRGQTALSSNIAPILNNQGGYSYGNTSETTTTSLPSSISTSYTRSTTTVNHNIAAFSN